jgi:hypothetical protein
MAVVHVSRYKAYSSDTCSDIVLDKEVEAIKYNLPMHWGRHPIDPLASDPLCKEFFDSWANVNVDALLWSAEY